MREEDAGEHAPEDERGEAELTNHVELGVEAEENELLGYENEKGCEGEDKVENRMPGDLDECGLMDSQGGSYHKASRFKEVF